MKKIISESEKNIIRNLYNDIRVGSLESKSIKSTLNEEQNKIRKLMSLPLLMETWNPSNAFKEVDCLKGLAKGMENLTGAVDDFVKNLGDYSATLSSKGIRTADDLYNAAVKWQTENIASLKNKLDDAALIDRYLVNTGAIKELEQSLINKTVKGIENKTMAALQELEDEIILDTSRLSGDELDVIGTLRTEASIGDDLSKEVLEQNKVKIGDAEIKIDDINRGIDKKISDLTPEGGRIADGTTEATIKALKNIRSELNNVKIALQKQKETVQSAIDQLIKKEEKESTSISWNGKTYEAVNLSKTQKALLKIGVDEFSPFIYKVVSFIIRGLRLRSLGDELMGNLAKIKELTVLSRSADSKVYQEQMQLVVAQLRNTIESLNGKYFNLSKPKSGMDLVKEIIGFGGNELETTWKEIVSILNSEVTIKKTMSSDEMVKILNDIKSVYSVVDDGARVAADDVNAFRGLLIFRTDLEDMGKQLGVKFENEFDNAIIRDSKDLSWLKRQGKSIRNKWRELTGTGFKNWALDLASGTVKIFFRWFVYGLPFNLRSYFKPIALYGFNLKSTMMVFSRLAISNFLSSFFFSGIFAVFNEWYRLTTMIFEDDYTAEMAERDAWAEWNKEMEAYSNRDFGAILGEMFNIENTDEISKRPISQKEYISNATRQYGPLKFKWLEVYSEVSSFFKAAPSKDQANTYKIKQQQELAEKTQNGVRKELKEKEDLFYSLDQEKQDKLSDVGTIRYNLADDDPEGGAVQKLDNATKTLINERLFTKVNFTGLPPQDINNLNDVKDVYLSTSNYNGYPCVCRKPLTYLNKQIKVGDEYKSAKIPTCDNYVRIVDMTQGSFTDGKLLNKERRDLQKYIGQAGFVTGKSATSGIPSILDWRPISQINQYLK